MGTLGAVVEASAPPAWATRADGKPAVILNVFAQPGASFVGVAKVVSDAMDALQLKDVTVSRFWNQAVLVSDAIAALRDVMLIGLVLSTLVLFFFLRDWASTVVAVLVFSGSGSRGLTYLKTPPAETGANKEPVVAHNAFIMQYQLRLYTIKNGNMDQWIREWRQSVYPLRVRFGFKVIGPWVIEQHNQFVWILGYGGSEAFSTRDSAYYASPERKAVNPEVVPKIGDFRDLLIRE